MNTVYDGGFRGSPFYWYLLISRPGYLPEELPTIIDIKRTKTWKTATDFLKILCDAIECIFKYCDEPLPARAKLYHEAQEWLFDEDEKEPFSFLNVCDSLNFDPSYLRRGVLDKMRAKSLLTLASQPHRTDRLARIGGQLKMSAHQGAKKRISL